MTFKEILNRINGISIPVFGIQWTPKQLEIDTARSIINFLEDKRVLYNAYELEMPYHCLQSVINIREYLTGQLDKVERSSEIDKLIRAMRTACRKLTDVGSSLYQLQNDRRLQGMGDEMTFFSAIGELRGNMGVYISQLLIMYGLDCEDDLAQILPLTPLISD